MQKNYKKNSLGKNFDTRAKNKFLFIIFFYFFFWGSTPEKMCIKTLVTVIGRKKNFFFRGKKFMIFVTVIGRFLQEKIHDHFFL